MPTPHSSSATIHISKGSKTTSKDLKLNASNFNQEIQEMDSCQTQESKSKKKLKEL